MKYLKLFEQFIQATTKKMYESASSKRSQGSINWFTKDEILDIREYAKNMGIAYIFNSSKKGYPNYFGTSNGVGLRESIANFFNGGDLCSEVHLSGETIKKQEGKFIVNGSNETGSIQEAFSMIER